MGGRASVAASGNVLEAGGSSGKSLIRQCRGALSVFAIAQTAPGCAVNAVGDGMYGTVAHETIQT